VVLVPVKATAIGKSRIAVPGPVRARLARAMAWDTVSAASRARRVRRVVALVEDEDDGTVLGGIRGVMAHHVRARGLNEAIDEGRQFVSGPSAGPVGGPQGPPVAVLPADLPSLRAAELDAALAAAAGLPLAVVADHQGTGTTLLAAAHAPLLDPHYGSGSFAVHLRVGAVPLVVAAASGLRRDVDVLADLAGVTGTRTAALVAETVADIPAS
jgi:2-phospho-L-lactate guanylyltransferase